MPSYGMPGMQNTALGPLQNRTWEQRMQNYMPSRVRQQYGFEGAAAGLGFDPYSLPGYGTRWGEGPWTQEQKPWSSAWHAQPRGQGQGQGQGGRNFLGPTRQQRGY